MKKLRLSGEWRQVYSAYGFLLMFCTTLVSSQSVVFAQTPKYSPKSYSKQQILFFGDTSCNTNNASPGQTIDTLNGFKLPTKSGPTGQERVVDPDGIMRGQGGPDEPIDFIDTFKKLPSNQKDAYGKYYITMRWSYSEWFWDGSSNVVDSAQHSFFEKNLPKVVVTNPKNNKSIVLAAIESGPGPSIGTQWRKDHKNKSTPAPSWWQGALTSDPSNYDGIVSGMTSYAMSALGVTSADLGYDANPNSVKLQYTWAVNQNSLPGTTDAAAVSTPTTTNAAVATAATASSGDLYDNSKEQIEKNKQIMYQFLIAKGLTPVQAVSWMANISAESGFFAPKLEGHYDYANGKWKNYDYSPEKLLNGFGLVQWTNTQGNTHGRRWKVFDTAKKQGKEVMDYQFQLDYMWNDLSQSYKKVYNDLKAANTISEAHDVILVEYEGPGEPYLSQRRETGPKLAAEYLKKYAGLDAAISGSGTASCNKSGANTGKGAAGEFGWDLSGPNTMVYYAQTDPKWANIQYGDGCTGMTIGSGGCGITSMAMIVSTLTGQTVLPPEMAKISSDNGFRVCGEGTAHGLAKYVANKYGLKYAEIGTDFDKAAAILKSGGLVWVSVGQGTFTSGGHLMVIRKVSPDGQSFYIADPFSEAGRTHGESNTKAYSRAELIGAGHVNVMYGLSPS